MSEIKFKYLNSINKSSVQLLVMGSNNPSKVSSLLDQDNKDLLKKSMKLENYRAKYNKSIELYGANNIDRILLLGLGDDKDISLDKLRALTSNLIRKFHSSNITSIVIDSKSFDLENNKKSQAFAEGLILGLYDFLDYKSTNKKKSNIKSIEFLGKCNSSSLEKGKVVAMAVNYARDMGNHPPNIMTPAYMANQATDIAKSKNMKSTIIDIKDFEKMGFGSFYGVAKGSVLPAKMIIVEYNGGNKNDKPLALVGKGLTFDTGGISLKPPTKMEEMKFDMCGSSTVMGVMKIVAELQPKINILFAIGATENMPGGNAQRPGDVVKAYNGKTIEIINTDAEGRLVLADVLAYVVDKYKPSAMIDFATLTGAVLIALGDRSSGVMGNNEKLMNEIKKSSDNSGEKVWELPLWKEYSKDIKSNIADIKNMGRGRLAGTIAAGVFLKEFVGNTPWVHMDIAGTAWGPKEPAYLPKNGATGVAVRLIYDFIENRK